MKKIIIISKHHREADKKRLFGRGYNLVLSQNPSIIDLPYQVAKMLIENNKVTFRSISWCMFPVIWAGDILKIEPIKSENAEIGDIVLYKSAGRAYAHRLVRTYREQGKLYIVTSGEKGYRNNQFSDYGGDPAENILGRVIEIKRGRVSFRPDEVKSNLVSLIQGRLKLSLWTLAYDAQGLVAKIFIRLQKVKLYRCFFKRLIKGRVSFFVGTSVIENMREVHNFCFYQEFDKFFKNFKGVKGLYNISARIYNKSVGNISLLLEKINNCKACTLSNFVVRTPFRGGGVGYKLLQKTLLLCSRINVDEIRVVLFEEDEIACKLFLKSGFNIVKTA